MVKLLFIFLIGLAHVGLSQTRIQQAYASTENIKTEKSRIDTCMYFTWKPPILKTQDDTLKYFGSYIWVAQISPITKDTILKRTTVIEILPSYYNLTIEQKKKALRFTKRFIAEEEKKLMKK